MTNKTRLDIPLLLPDIPDLADACVSRLISDLKGRSGIEDAHVLVDDGRMGAKLCVHYAPDVVSLSRIREIARTSGGEITERFGHKLWKVKGYIHQRRAQAVRARICELPGILEAEATAAGSIRVEFDRSQICEEAILNSLGEMGVETETNGRRFTDDHNKNKNRDDNSRRYGGAHAHGSILGFDKEMAFALACGVCLGVGFAIEMLIDGAPGWLSTSSYVAAYVFGSFFTLREAIDNLRRKRFEIDTLMLVAAVGAAALGAWAEGALLLFLFSLGHALEHYAMGRAKRAIEALAKLAPETAIVRRNGESQVVSVEELIIGDVVIVRPNERLPADGFVVRGTTSINQAPVTGESIPVDKLPVDAVVLARARPGGVDASSRVFAGTINGAGAIEIEVTRRSADTALAKVVRMVSEAETRQSPTQRFTERFERIFVPAVLGLAVALLFAWIVVDEPFRDSFYRAMAVLVAASPCALAIATPSAVLSGIARAARGGVLVKGGAPLEELGSLNAIAFDKTGTLTEGRPRITDVVPVDDITEKELLSTAVAVEALSDHPLAAAIVRDGRERLGESASHIATELNSLAGKGVAATLDDETVWIGKAEMFGNDDVPKLGEASSAAIAELRQSGRTTMAVRRGDRDLGVIGLMDTPRSAARVALNQLRVLGVTHMIMISGDHQKVAEVIAKEVGLDEAIGDLMPADKVEAVRKLRAQTKVAMVGDGVNDAPAMANASVGIAMGAAGSDVALDTADVALMADDLLHLPFAVGLSRQTRAVIRQNVFVSLGVVALLVPATILGLGIGPAVAMHEGSTLLVVVNALRLLAYRNLVLASSKKNLL